MTEIFGFESMPELTTVKGIVIDGEGSKGYLQRLI